MVTLPEISLPKGWPALGPSQAITDKLHAGKVLTEREFAQLRADAEKAERLEQTDPDFQRATRRYRAICAEEDRIAQVRREYEESTAAVERNKRRVERRRQDAAERQNRRLQRGAQSRLEVQAEQEEKRSKLVARIAMQERRALVRETIQKALVAQSRAEGHAERVMFTDPKMLGDSPGPAAYMPKPEWAEGGACFGEYSKTDVRKVNESQPGPGSYDPKYDSGPGYSFGVLTGKKTGDQALPGPGSYHVSPLRSKGGTISSHVVKSELERDLERAAQQPGPGDYEHGHVLDRGKSSTISGRTRNAADFALYQASRRPGPGTYEPPTARVRGGVMGIKRRNPGTTSLPALPGPGSYYQTPTMKEEREMRELSRQVLRLVKDKGGGKAPSRSAPQMLGSRSRDAPKGVRSHPTFETITEASMD